MTPHLTGTGRIILVTAATLILLGVMGTRWPVLFLGESLAVLLTLTYFVQIPSLLAIEEGFVRLKLRSSIGAGSPGGVAGEPAVVEMELTNRSRLALHNVRLLVEQSGGLALDPEVVHLGTVRARERITVSISLRAQVAGRYVIHGFRARVDGLLGLVAVSDYLATPLPLKFLPAAAAGRRGLPQTTRRSTDTQRVGAHLLRRRGFGTDFRELRDHAIGDPFRSIAWKATARTGKLMVREFEDEVIANAFVLLDISSTMRGGTPPRTKLNHAVELISEFAQTLSRFQDRIGLITFDEVVYGHLRTGSARALLPQLVNHLCGLTSVVDPDFTELDEEEVVAELVPYLMVQERLDFRLRKADSERLPGGDPIDAELLEYWVGRVLPSEAERLGDRCLESGVVHHQALSAVRRFCQLRGVPVPYRLEARFGAKEQGMVQALERFLVENRESHFVLLVTDLCGLVETRGIVEALKLVLSRKHRVELLMPYTPDYVSVDGRDEGRGGEYDRGAALYEIFRLAERRERARIARSISALGIPVVATGPEDTMDTVLRRIGLHREL